MSANNWLAGKFEENRAHLRAVAYRMLGSLSEAEDAVQEAWLKLSRSDTAAVENLSGWLTTVVARVCLDMLRARKSRREESLDTQPSDASADREKTADAETEALMADSVGLAMLVVLQTLAPPERIAFVLHDMFDLSFDEIAPIVGRSPTAARQLASRARRRVQGSNESADADLSEHRQVVDAFLAASRNGDFDSLVAMLDKDVVFRADEASVQKGAKGEVRGAPTVAKFFSGRAQNARSALIDGKVGVVVAPRGRLIVVLGVTIKDGKITAIEAIADPTRLSQLELGVIKE
jgi:RNA polymerase sigma-70 factor (ECF subfamily)